MELDHFLEGLKNALVDRGIPPEAAAKHVAALGRTFTADDLAEIQSIRSPAEIGEIADSIAEILYKNKAARTAAKNGQMPSASTSSPSSAYAANTQPPEEPSSMATTAMPPAEEATDPVVRPTIQPTEEAVDAFSAAPVASPREDTVSRHEQPSRQEPSYSRSVSQPQQRSADFFRTPTERDKTTKGVAIFWSVLIVTLPITLTLLIAILALFGVAFLGIILAIIGLVAGMIGVVAAGCGLALVGIIYGITQLFSFVAAGLYEIGLGVMIIGGALLAGVILYNLAIRFLPWVMKWLTVFFVFVFHRLRNLFYLARRECYKL